MRPTAMSVLRPRSRRWSALALLPALALTGAGTTLRHSSTTLAAPRSGAVVAPAARETVDADGVSVGRVSATARAAVGSPGYAYLASSIVGQTPAGFSLWVSGSAKHHWVMGKYASSTAVALRRLGIKITYRGYGTPAAAEGVIRVFEGVKGCGSNGSTVGMTWTYWSGLSTGQQYVTHADVYLCPRLFRLGTWATQATVGHELGHAMGLGHVPYRYLGSYQLMNPTVRRGLVTYRSGDRSGLQRLARQTSSIRLDIPPMGKLDKSTFQKDGTIDFTGWALLKFAKGSAVQIELTDNGQVVQNVGTTVLRPDVNAAQDPGTRRHGYDIDIPWPGGHHEYCVRATAVGHPEATAQLGCVTWSG